MVDEFYGAHFLVCWEEKPGEGRSFLLQGYVRTQRECSRWKSLRNGTTSLNGTLEEVSEYVLVPHALQPMFTGFFLLASDIR